MAPPALAHVPQTTLGPDEARAIIEALRNRFPDLIGLDTRDICQLTWNRHPAVRVLAQQVDVLLVVGAANSSDGNRQREIGAAHGISCYLSLDAVALGPERVAGAGAVGSTAGVSAPESLVQGVIPGRRHAVPAMVAARPGSVEDVQFRLPAAPDQAPARAAA